MIGRNPSPLRYPGGKVSLCEVLKSIIYANGKQGGTYVEPFAGGAGAGLKLLREGHVDSVVINDADRSIYSFWKCVMGRTGELVKRVKAAKLTMPEWRHQRDVYRRPGRRSEIDVGFAAFYLNRCNRSGIIKNGGPIGGIEQKGEWKLDARFNREDLAERIEELASYGDRITVLRRDARDLVGELDRFADVSRCFVYADPPYYVKGRELYLNHFDDDDHMGFAEAIREQAGLSWVATYDDVARIRELYDGDQIMRFNLRYSAHLKSVKGSELLIAPQHVVVPHDAKKALGIDVQ